MNRAENLSFQHQALIQQGFQCYTPAELKQLEWGLRFTPFVCSLITLMGLLLHSPFILLTVSALGFLAFFFPAGHPMDLLYNHVVRHAFGAVALPPNPLQRRLACLSAAVMNIIAAVLFALNLTTAALITGGMLLILQAIVIATHLCVLSWMYEGILRALGKWNTPLEITQVQKLRDEGALLVDVRGCDEFQRGHLKNAINVPLEQIKEYAQNNQWQDKKVVLYCFSGMRSHVAMEVLKKAGFEHAYSAGGMERLEKIFN